MLEADIASIHYNTFFYNLQLFFYKFSDFAEKQVFFKAMPHKDCCTDAKSDFSSDWLKTTQAYWRKSRSFWLI
jgi:hypothetical protein